MPAHRVCSRRTLVSVSHGGCFLPAHRVCSRRTPVSVSHGGLSFAGAQGLQPKDARKRQPRRLVFCRRTGFAAVGRPQASAAEACLLPAHRVCSRRTPASVSYEGCFCRRTEFAAEGRLTASAAKAIFCRRTGFAAEGRPQASAAQSFYSVNLNNTSRTSTRWLMRRLPTIASS